MSAISLRSRVKFGPPVWHDQPYVLQNSSLKNERDFYDRNEELKIALPTLMEPSIHVPIVVIGERRSGKTSLLKLLLHKLSEDQRFISIYIPWLGINSAPKLMREFLHSLFRELLLDDITVKEKINQVNNLIDFQVQVKEILGNRTDVIVVFCIDEIDSILLQSDLDQTSKSEIFSLIGFLIESSVFPIKLVLSSTCEPEKFGADYILKTKTENIRLKPFPTSDLSEMLNGILGNDFQVTDQEQNALYEVSGGWPYFAKALLYYLVQYSPDGKDLARAISEAIKNDQIIGTWEHIYESHWGDYERAVILFLAKHGGKVTIAEINLNNLNFKIALHQLIERGYIINDAIGYRLRIGLLQNWLTQWIRFEEQTHRYRGLIANMAPERDPWLGVEDEIIEISKEDFRRRGF